MPFKPRRDSYVPSSHGGINYAELEEKGISVEAVVDFSANTNPFGPPPAVLEALAYLRLDRYPDSKSTKLRRALAAKMGVAPQNILVGNGSTELIRLTALTYLDRDDVALIPQPAFGEYEAACTLVGTTVIKPAEEKENFYFNLPDIIRHIKTHHPGAIFLANPNNPTGQYLSQEEVIEILEAAARSLVVLDEAYASFVTERWPSVDLIKRGNLLLLRSMTKDYALAGLRLGYIIGETSLVENLSRFQPPWQVNVAAQEAGVRALGEDGYLRACQVKLKEGKDFLIKELTAMSLPPLPSRANFFLLKVGDGKECRSRLLKKGILVRDCASFGLPKYIRIAARGLPDCRKLMAAIKECGVLELCRVEP